MTREEFIRFVVENSITLIWAAFALAMALLFRRTLGCIFVVVALVAAVAYFVWYFFLAICMLIFAFMLFAVIAVLAS